MAEFFFLPESLENPTAPTMDDLRNALKFTSCIEITGYTIDPIKEHTMGNVYNSDLRNSQGTLMVTDRGVSIANNIPSIDFKKEDLHAIAADILAIGGIPEVASNYLTAEQRADRYTEDELTHFAYSNLQAVQIKRDLKAAEAKREEAREAKRKEEAERAKEEEFLNSPEALKALAFWNSTEGVWRETPLNSWAEGNWWGNLSLTKIAHSWIEQCEADQKRKHEILREEVAVEFFGKELYYLKPKALKAVDEIISLRQQVSDAIGNQ